MNKLRSLFVAILCVAMLTGCGGSGDYYDSGESNFGVATNGTAGFNPSYDVDCDDEYDYIESETNDELTPVAAEDINPEKLIYSCYFNIETTSYSEDIKKIKDLIKEYNGIIESEAETSDSGGYYWETGFDSGCTTNGMTVRILSTYYDSFTSSVGSVGHIIGKTQTVSNITQSYYDNQSMIESLKIQEKRLLEMYDSAYTIEDMIRVESRLTEIQSQLRMYQTRMSQMDTDVKYAIVNIRLTEVKIYTPDEKDDTFLNRLWKTIEDTWFGFLDFLEGLLFSLIKAIPYIPILYIAYLLWKGIKKNTEAKKQDMGAPKE